MGTYKVIKWLLESGERCTPPLSKPTVAFTASKTKVDDLLPMATRIAASTEPKIDITLELLDVLKDVINGRQLCADWYAALAKQPQQGGSENDKTHQYFLDVLKKIYEILQKEHKSRRPKRKKKMPQLPTDTGDLTNLFQHLGLEETAEETPEAVTPLFDGTRKVKQPTVNAKLEDSKHEQEETMFAVWALLHDFHGIRKSTRKTMKRFVDGKISFMAVAQATIDAMHVSASIADQFRQECPKLQGFNDIIRLLGVERFYGTANAAQYCENLEPSWEEANKEAELLCVDGWTVAATAKSKLSLKLVTEIPERTAHLTHDLVPRPETPLHPLSRYFASAFSELERLQESNQYDRSPDSLAKLWCCTDVYTFTLYNFFLKVMEGCVDFGVVIATSLYCDLHDAVKGNMEVGFNICSSLITQQTTEMFDHMKTLFEDEVQSSSQVPSDVKEWLRKEQNLVAPHTSKEGVEGWLYQISEENRSFVPRTLLEIFPLLAASLARQCCEAWENLGVNLCNLRQHVLATAHLHKALAAGHQAKQWPDLDFLVKAQDKSSRPFLRQNEVDVDMVFKEYALALGFTLNQVRGTQKPKLKSSLNARYPDALHLRPAIVSTKEKIETGFMNHRLGFKSRFGDLSAIYNGVKKYHTATGIQDKEICNQWEQTKKLSASQLLQVLHEIALHEERFAYFDYIGFYLLCLDLLKFASTCIELSGRQIGNKSDRGLWLFEVVFEILSDAATDHKRGLSKENSALGEIAEYFDGEIARHASKFVDGSRAQVQRQIDVAQATCRTPVAFEHAAKELMPYFAVNWNDFLAAIRGDTISDASLQHAARIYQAFHL